MGCLGLGASQECLLFRLSGSYLLPTVAVQVKWDDAGIFRTLVGTLFEEQEGRTKVGQSLARGLGAWPSFLGSGFLGRRAGLWGNCRWSPGVRSWALSLLKQTGSGASPGPPCPS